MLSKQEEEQERRETLENDLRVLRERGSTFHQHAQSAANDTGGGRFASLGAPHVTGSSAVPIYPAGPQWTADPGSQVVEPPLPAFENSALANPTGDVSSGLSPPVVTDAPAGATASLENLPPAQDEPSDAGASPFSKDRPNE